MTPELAKLLNELREIFDSKPQMGAAAARNRQAAALSYIADLLVSLGLERSHWNEMMQLVNALNDLNDGTVAPLLQPVFVSNRPRDTTDVWLGRTQVALAFELLRQAGHSRNSAIEFINRRQKHILHLLTGKTKHAGKRAANWHWQLLRAQVGSSKVLDAFEIGLHYVSKRVDEGLNIEEADVEADRMLKNDELIWFVSDTWVAT